MLKQSGVKGVNIMLERYDVLRFQYEGNAGYYTFGINEVNGIFLRVYNKNQSTDFTDLEFYEFSPFHTYFTMSNINNAIDKGEFNQDDIEAIFKYPIGHYHVYFEKIQPIKSERFWPELLEAFEREGNPPIEVKNLKDYFEFVNHFDDSGFGFGEVTWLSLNPHNVLCVFKNHLPIIK